MIQKSGQYYTYQDPVPQQKINLGAENKKSSASVTFEATGNVKQKIQAIRQRFNQIKQNQKTLEQKNKNQNQLSIFEKINAPNQESSNQIDVDVYIPEQILKLDEKLSKIQEKLKPNEIMRRKIESKGTLVQRIKLLQQKLKNVLEKSSEIIVNNIQNYCSALDDKDDYLKIIFLRQSHSKVQGMKQEINVLQSYLKSLNHIQTKIKAIEPIEKSVKTHENVIQLRANLNDKIKTLFNHMKTSYTQLLQQIDNLPV